MTILDKIKCVYILSFFYSYGGVRLGLCGNTACNGPIIHLPTDERMWDTGHIVTDRRKLKYSQKNLSQWHFV
jgi:hypothetical protein